MSARGETRRLAHAAACEIAAKGQRPSIAAIREHLGGRGGQQAIIDGLNDWIADAARRFEIPGIPESLRSLVVDVWDRATTEAATRWQDERQQWEGRLAECQARTQHLDAQWQASLARIDDLTARLAREQAQVADLRGLLGERDEQMRRLTNLLEREQAARDAERSRGA